MTTIKLDKNGYPIRSAMPRWLITAHIAGLIIATYALVA
jgi:hypothetical protein